MSIADESRSVLARPLEGSVDDPSCPVFGGAEVREPLAAHEVAVDDEPAEKLVEEPGVVAADLG